MSECCLSAPSRPAPFVPFCPPFSSSSSSSYSTPCDATHHPAMPCTHSAHPPTSDQRETNERSIRPSILLTDGSSDRPTDGHMCPSIPRHVLSLPPLTVGLPSIPLVRVGSCAHRPGWAHSGHLPPIVCACLECPASACLACMHAFLCVCRLNSRGQTRQILWPGVGRSAPAVRSESCAPSPSLSTLLSGCLPLAGRLAQ